MTDNKKDFFSIFKKKEEKKIIFDENYFEINIIGGKIHSDKIIIEAISKYGGDKLNLSCNWFMISPQNDIHKLDIQDNFYQPNIEDVGYKFMIQAVPSIEGKEYEGMPKSCEVGPLERDESIQEEIDELLENEKMTVLLQIQEILKSSKPIELELPTNCFIKITLQNMELEIKKEEQPYFTIQSPLSAQYPQCRPRKSTPDEMSLILDAENEFILKASDNQQRDIIITVLKGFYGKSVWKDQEQQQKQELEQEQVGNPDLVESEEEQVEIQLDPQNIAIDNSEQILENITIETVKSEKQSQSPEQSPKKQPKTQSIDKDQDQEVIQLQEIKESAEQLEIEIPKLHDTKSHPLRTEQRFHSVLIHEQPEEKLSPTKKSDKKNNMELFMLINENVKLKQEITNGQIQLQKEIDNNRKNQQQIQTLTNQLNNCTKNYYTLEEENTNQKKLIDQLKDQRVFLQQDVNMYKGQMIEFQEQIETLKQQIEQLQKKLKRQAITQDLNEAKKHIEQLNHTIAKKELIIEAQESDHNIANKKIEELEKIIENLQNELYHERKKYDSLAQEKGIKPSNSNQSSNGKEKIVQDRRIAQSAVQLEDADKIQIEFPQSAIMLDLDHGEIQRLKTQIMHLEATLRSLKIAYDQDVRLPNNKGKPIGKLSNSNNKDIKYLQHIANNMAEIITEKEMQLENQKNINKELIAKVQRLQEQQR